MERSLLDKEIDYEKLSELFKFIKEDANKNVHLFKSDEEFNKIEDEKIRNMTPKEFKDYNDMMNHPLGLPKDLWYVPGQAPIPTEVVIARLEKERSTLPPLLGGVKNVPSLFSG
jgi:hypothetical protein